MTDNGIAHGIQLAEGGLLLVGEYEYADRRMGLSWPGPKNPGYLAVFGLERHVDPATGQRTIRLLIEQEAPDVAALFKKASGAAGFWYCRDAFALGSQKNEYFFDAYSIWARKRGYSFLRLNDVSDISSFEAGRAIAVRLASDGAIDVPRGTTLRTQSDAITPEDVKTSAGLDPNARWYAAAAMNHVLISWEYYPYAKPPVEEEKRAGEGYR